MIDIDRIGLWGCSAGANLAANVALRDSFENEVSRIRHVNLAVPITCHPSLYPPVLKSSNASMSLFHAQVSLDDATKAVGRLWGRPFHSYSLFILLTAK
jgi:acetyl esterase/lipase